MIAPLNLSFKLYIGSLIDKGVIYHTLVREELLIVSASTKDYHYDDVLYRSINRANVFMVYKHMVSRLFATKMYELNTCSHAISGEFALFDYNNKLPMWEPPERPKLLE